MRLRSVLEAAPNGHRQELMSMQQALLDIGWDDVKILPATNQGYHMKLSHGNEKFDLDGFTKDREHIGWYLYDLSASKKNETDVCGITVYGEILIDEDYDSALRELSVIFTEVELKTELLKHFEIHEKETKTLGSSSNYLVRFEIGPKGSDLTDNNQPYAYAIVKFELHQGVYSHVYLVASTPNNGDARIESLQELIDVCKIRLQPRPRR